MSFREVEDNLRESFRVLAGARPSASVIEMPGVSIASLGVAFQMFNAAFLSARVESQAEMESRLQTVRAHFTAQGLAWSFWICEDWLADGVQRKLSRTCESFGLRLVSEMPGMIAEQVAPPVRPLPRMEIRRVDSVWVLEDFRRIGSACFHVPIGWFSEVFDAGIHIGREFVCWVGYCNGIPVATAASLTSNGVAGLYNVATAPEHRARGCGEAMTRHAIDVAIAEEGAKKFVLQSTSFGLRIYERMAFRPVTRILVYNSGL